MLQLVEMEGKMTENGCIEIPAVVLEQAGICTCLLYTSDAADE